jgi:hypothetical protein
MWCLQICRNSVRYVIILFKYFIYNVWLRIFAAHVYCILVQHKFNRLIVFFILGDHTSNDVENAYNPLIIMPVKIFAALMTVVFYTLMMNNSVEVLFCPVLPDIRKMITL